MAGKGKRGAKGGKGGKGRRGGKRASNLADYAQISCKRSIAPSGATAYNTNTLYSLMNTQLVDFPRAVQVAAAFQHYKIKKVRLTFKPTSDNFLAAAGAVSKPNLYYMIDKSGSIPTNVSLEGLKGMGARPKQLDENNFTIEWSPTVLESVMYASGGVGASAASKYRTSPWLTTTADNVSPGAFVPSGIDHLGVYWYVDQLLNPIGYQYTCEVEVQFEFKKPLINMLAQATAIPSVAAVLNDSPDGVVGGGDGV